MGFPSWSNALNRSHPTHIWCFQRTGVSFGECLAQTTSTFVVRLNYSRMFVLKICPWENVRERPQWIDYDVMILLLVMFAHISLRNSLLSSFALCFVPYLALRLQYTSSGLLIYSSWFLSKLVVKTPARTHSLRFNALHSVWFADYFAYPTQWFIHSAHCWIYSACSVVSPMWIFLWYNNVIWDKNAIDRQKHAASKRTHTR